MNSKLIAFISLIMLSIQTHCQLVTQATLGTFNNPTPKFGFNTNAQIPPDTPSGSGYVGANWTQSWFIDSAAFLYPEILRYPGGTNANHWDWKTGWFRPCCLPPGGTSLTIRTDEFKPGVLACNAEGLYVVNMETSTAHYEMDGLRHADSIGLDPKYIELGNEHNLDGGSLWPLQLMTPQAYSQLAKEYHDSIMAVFPTAKVCAVGGNTPGLAHWVDSVLHYMPTIDALSFHVYINANNTSDGLFHVNRALAEPFRIGTTPTPSLDYRYTLSGFPSDKEVWVTEYNLLETPSGLPQIISQSWTHVLFNTAMHEFFLHKPNVTMILNHSLADGVDHFQSISRQNKRITANGVSVKLMSDVARGSLTCQNITFSGSYTITYGSTTFPKLLGWKFNHPGVEKGFICNLSKDTFDISLATIFTNPMHFDQYYADTALVVQGLSSLNKYSGYSTDTIRVYPYSITQIDSGMITGIDENTISNGHIWLFPNPSTHSITIQTEMDMDMADIFLYDLSGKEIRHFENVKGKVFSIDLETLESGLYLFKIISGDMVTTGRLIKD